MIDGIDAFALENQPEHPVIKHIVVPEQLAIECNDGCNGCPAKDAHPTYKRAKLTAPLDDNQRLSLLPLYTFQWLVHRMCADARELEGSTPGYLNNAGGSYNFCDALSWNVTAVDGNRITLQPVSGSALAQVIYQYPIEGGASGKLGVLQPGDEIEFLSPSALRSKCRPTVVRKVSESATEVVADLDQDVSCALSSNDVENPTLTTVQCKSWRYAGNLEQFIRILKHSWFYGRWRQFAITPSGNGVWTYDNALYPYRAGDTDNVTPATLRVMAYDGTAWTDIATEFQAGGGRFFQRTLQTDANDPETISYQTILCFGGEDYNGDPLPDLSLVYERFIVHAIELTGPDNYSVIPGHARCANSWFDRSGSVNGAPNGVGTGCMCGLRRWHNTDLETWEQPTGLADGQYPSDGRCMMAGVCDKWKSFDTVANHEKPFTQYYVFARWLEQIECAANIKYVQANPSDPETTTVRVNNPSLRSLLGSYPLSTPVGIHPTVTFPDWGLNWGDVEVVTDEDGNETLQLKTKGHAFDIRADLADVDVDDFMTYPPDGHLPAFATDYEDKLNPLAYTSNVTNTEDPSFHIRNYEDRCGIGNAMDSGAMVGRGRHTYSHATGDEPVILERVDLYKTGTQERPDAILTILETPETVLGQEVSAYIDVRPLRQVEKEPIEIVSGTINSIVPLGEGRYQIDIENGLHVFTYTDGPPGETFDHDVPFLAGGTFVKPPNWQRVWYYNEPGKSVGSTRELCCAGDTVAIGGLDGKRFLVLSAFAHAGEQAPDWGDGYSSPGQITQAPNFEEWARRRDRIIIIDEAGYIAEALSRTEVPRGTPITCYASDGGWMPPAQLGAAPYREPVWTPVNGCIYEHGIGRVWITTDALWAMREDYADAIEAGQGVCLHL